MQYSKIKPGMEVVWLGEGYVGSHYNAADYTLCRVEGVDVAHKTWNHRAGFLYGREETSHKGVTLVPLLVQGMTREQALEVYAERWVETAFQDVTTSNTRRILDEAESYRQWWDTKEEREAAQADRVAQAEALNKALAARLTSLGVRHYQSSVSPYEVGGVDMAHVYRLLELLEPDDPRVIEAKG